MEFRLKTKFEFYGFYGFFFGFYAMALFSRVYGTRTSLAFTFQNREMNSIYGMSHMAWQAMLNIINCPKRFQ
jgi:hypothetical protein